MEKIYFATVAPIFFFFNILEWKNNMNKVSPS